MARPTKVYAPILWLTIAFILGIISVGYFQFTVPIPIIISFAILLSILSFGTKTGYKSVAILFAFFALGFARMELDSIRPATHWTNFKYVRSVRGIISNFPEYSENRWSAEMKLISVHNGEQFMPSSGNIRIYFREPEKSLAYGQLWEFSTAPMSIEHKTGNYYKYLKRKNIDGIIWTTAEQSMLLDEDRGNILLRKIIAPLRNKITMAVMNSLPGERGALLEGMLLGGGRKLSPQTKSFFADTGVIHILAVSGLHIGIIAFALLWLLRTKIKLSYIWSVGIMVIILMGYSLLVQLRPSVLRASIMMVFLLSAPLVHRKSNPLNALAAAGLFILLFRPTDIYSPGFQLSFAAAGGIIYLFPRISAFFDRDLIIRKNISARALQLILVTISAQLVTAPIAIFHFNKFQLIAPISNFFIIPVVMPVISAGFIGAIIWMIIPSVGKTILSIDGLLLDYILFVVKTLSKFPYSFIPIAKPLLTAIFGYFIFVFIGINIIWHRTWKTIVPASIGILLILTGMSNSLHRIYFPAVDGSAVYIST
ncbi:hypothetical protein DRQ33_04505, partial [bacterium]